MEAASALQIQVPGVRFAWRVTPLRIALALGALALVVRTIGLGLRPLWLDEGYSAWFSARGWHYLWSVVPTYEPHPPFYYSVLKVWRAAFGGGAVALRSLSVLFSVVTVPVMVAAAYELERLDPTGRPHLRAFVAAILAACSPMLVMLDQEARPYPLLIFAYAVAILGLARLTREFRVGGAGRWLSWAMLGAGTQIVLWAHGLGILYAACLMLALLPTWLARPFDRRRIVRGLAVAAATLAAYAPCLVMIMSRSGDWGTGWLAWKPIMTLQLLGLYSIPYEALTVGSAIAAFVLLLLMKRAIQSALETPGWNVDRLLLILWLGPPLLAVIISMALMPVFLTRTLSATLVPAYLAVASTLARTPSERERTFLAAAIAIILIPSALYATQRPPMERWSDVRDYLARHVGASDQVWVYPNDSAVPLGEAGLRIRAHGIPGDYPATSFKGPIRAGSPAVVSLTHDQALAIAAKPEVADVPTVWLVTRQSELFDPKAELPSALAQRRRAGHKQEWDYIAVQPFSLPGAHPR
jgi:hypothetical protein